MVFNSGIIMEKIIGVIAVSFISGLLGAIAVSKYGVYLGLADKPNERSSHSVVTPRGGGIGFLFAMAFTGFVVLKAYLFTIIAIFVGAISFMDDLTGLSAKTKLFFQLTASAAAVIVYADFHYSVPHLLSFLFWVAFMVWSANSYNFMDGINGIAGLTGLVAFGLTAFFSYYELHNQEVALVSLGLAAGSLGFLPLNFPKAQVFMGDVGSVFLGFIFSFLVMKSASGLSEIVCLFMFMFMFYGDALLTILFRLKDGENLLQAHRRHLYQYMSNEIALPQGAVSLLYAAIQVVIGILAIWAYRINLNWQFALLIVCMVLFICSYLFIKTIKTRNNICKIAN